jgi:pyruvate phosphate dikinase-like enzyme
MLSPYSTGEAPRVFANIRWLLVLGAKLIHRISKFLWLAITVACAGLIHPIIAQPRIWLAPTNEYGWMRVRGEEPGDKELLTLHASSNLLHWRTIAVMHGRSFEFADPATPNVPQRFYRFNVAPLNPTNDWKNQIGYPYENFQGYGGGQGGWTKFAVLVDDSTRVFYADSRRFTFHYDFATARLEGLIGISPADFERIALHNADRRVVVGTVLNPGYPRNEYGIQFVSDDPLPRELVRDVFQLVRSTVIPDPFGEPRVQAFYIPTFEQAAAAAADAGYFASNNIPVSSADRWIGGDICYSRGWALGTLKYFSAAEVSAAYADGRLGPSDILLTDGIPAELPYVSGIVTLTPTTANSHVAILAQSYGVPFAYLVDAADRERVAQLANQEVAFQTSPEEFGACKVLLVPVDPPLEPAVRAELFALRPPPRFEVLPKERYGAYTERTDNLVPSQIKYFGGKASNYGLLRRVIPSNSLPAIAISFDLWDDFMSQVLGNGHTLRQEISNRLAGFSYPPDVAALQIQLGEIRTLIRNSTQFTLEQQAAITNALTVFDRRRNIRFRSSTNVEDAESFTGAGLYDSYSGCLADDQDGDNRGPSICDPTEDDERGVFRAIRRVFASFYNDNAFLERLRLGVNEDHVGMAVLVHHSTPDPTEMANGVATGTWFRNPREFNGRMISQLGAVPVANPDGSATPEEVSFYTLANQAPSVSLKQSSSLVRLGESVMNWASDYLDLASLLDQVAQGYGMMLTNKSRVQLDLEYKKVQPGVLEVKQVREIPIATNHYVAPFVLNQPEVVYANWHGFYDDIFRTHRLKSRWTFRHRNVPFTPAHLNAGFYTDVTIDYLDGTNVATIAGPMGSLSNFVHQTFADPWSSLGIVEDHWTIDTASGTITFGLRTAIYPEADSRSPFQTLAPSFFQGPRLQVQFPEPLLEITPFGEIRYEIDAETRLYPLRPEAANDRLMEKSYSVPGQGRIIQIDASYWLPEEARGDDCRCPVLRIVESRISGFTSEPIVLRGYWSQTFNDIHNNDYQQFIFEPRLEAGLPAAQLAELAAANVAQIYVNGNGGEDAVLMIIGLDGTPRRFSDADF